MRPSAQPVMLPGRAFAVSCRDEKTNASDGSYESAGAASKWPEKNNGMTMGGTPLFLIIYGGGGLVRASGKEPVYTAEDWPRCRHSHALGEIPQDTSVIRCNDDPRRLSIIEIVFRPTFLRHDPADFILERTDTDMVLVCLTLE